MKLKFAGLGLLAMALAGCGTVTGVTADGQPDGEIQWPEPYRDNTFDNHKGTYGDLNALNLIRNGATRDAIMQAIGRPQYHEGFHVREWNYLFTFHQKDGSDLVCQFKVLFDTDYIARNFMWRTVSPAGASCPVNKKTPQRYTFSADALFRFDGGHLNDLLPGGKDELDELVKTIQSKGSTVTSVKVIGYTDRLGSDAYNQRLSDERANTVKSYLAAHGLSARLITAVGRGEQDPVVQCNEKDRNALIACLQPNRRVEVEVK